jgi:hypothetical protein
VPDHLVTMWPPLQKEGGLGTAVIVPAVEDSSAEPALSSKYKCRAQVFDYLERETGIEPATFSLGS